MRGGDSRGPIGEPRWWHIPALTLVLLGAVVLCFAMLEWALHR